MPFGTLTWDHEVDPVVVDGMIIKPTNNPRWAGNRQLIVEVVTGLAKVAGFAIVSMATIYGLMAVAYAFNLQ